MNRLLFSLLVLLVGVRYGSAQDRSIKGYALAGCGGLSLQGPLIMARPYMLVFDTSQIYNVTFNERALQKENNKFLLNSSESGILKVYKILDNRDTQLVEQTFLKFEIPQLDITLNGKLPGATIQRSSLKYATFTAGLLNSEVTYSFPYDEIVVSFRERNIMLKMKIEQNFISHELLDRILDSGSDILILQITIRFGYQSVKLQPAVYFLE